MSQIRESRVHASTTKIAISQRRLRAMLSVVGGVTARKAFSRTDYLVFRRAPKLRYVAVIPIRLKNASVNRRLIEMAHSAQPWPRHL
jgi:hypothetical protein